MASNERARKLGDSVLVTVKKPISSRVGLMVGSMVGSIGVRELTPEMLVSPTLKTSLVKLKPGRTNGKKLMATRIATSTTTLTEHRLEGQANIPGGCEQATAKVWSQVGYFTRLTVGFLVSYQTRYCGLHSQLTWECLKNGLPLFSRFISIFPMKN
jgi:hypothetical protein